MESKIATNTAERLPTRGVSHLTASLRTMASKESEMAATVHQEEMHSNLDMTDKQEVKEKTDLYAADPHIEIDKATDRRLFWKITRRVLVIQVITYFCQSLDKGILNYASIMGIKDDTHLVGQQVSLPYVKHFSRIADAYSCSSIHGWEQFSTLAFLLASIRRTCSYKSFLWQRH